VLRAIARAGFFALDPVTSPINVTIGKCDATAFTNRPPTVGVQSQTSA
jgi:hypothetical protein